MRLDLVVGPNGSGKSTFVRLDLAPVRPGVVFVNADEIASRHWPEEPELHAYEAADIASQTRAALIGRGEPLIAETVFSHPSKLELLLDASAAHYHTALHVMMVPKDLAVARVAARVAAGGHSVPVDKIRQRYDRLWPLVADAITLASTATVYDNSHHHGPVEVATFEHGVPTRDPVWRVWTPEVLATRWPATSPS